MNNNVQTRSQKAKSRDRLQGAPGHQAADQETETTNTKKASGRKARGDAGYISKDLDAESGVNAMGAVVTKELADIAPGVIEDIISKLGTVFGEESVEKFRSLLAVSTIDTEEAFYNIVRAAVPNLPKDFSINNLSALADWEPVKNKITKHPVASAATVAAGVGALFLVREYLNRGTSSRSVKPSKGKKLAGVKLSSAKSSKGKASKAKKSSTKAAPKKGAKSKAKKSTGKSKSR